MRYLIERPAMGVLMKLYGWEGTESDIATLYGANREELIRLAGLWGAADRGPLAPCTPGR